MVCRLALGKDFMRLEALRSESHARSLNIHQLVMSIVAILCSAARFTVCAFTCIYEPLFVIALVVGSHVQSWSTQMQSRKMVPP